MLDLAVFCVVFRTLFEGLVKINTRGRPICPVLFLRRDFKNHLKI